MEELRDIEDEAYNDQQDLVEYTTEDEPDELDHGTMSINLEDLVEESNRPELSTDEEYENYEDDEKSSSIQLADSSKTMPALRNTVSISGLQKVGNNASTERVPPKVVMVPQSTAAPTTTTPMKLLNTSRTSLPSTMATTSYRLLNSEGTMIVNVSNKPAAVKKIISVSNPAATQQNLANRVVLNTKSQVMHIQPQNLPVSSGTGLKTMKTITMKTIPGGTIKMVPQTTTLPSGLQGTMLRMTKPTIAQAVPLAGTSKITKTIANNGGNEMSKVVLKPATSNTGARKIIAPSNAPLHAVTLPGGKGVQYVRLLNQLPGTTTGQKIVMQSPGKTTGIITSSAGMNVVNAGTATSTAGTIQPGPSKIVVQNNKTFVIRNGTANLAAIPTNTTAIGKPSVLSTGKKIILNSSVNAGTTRILLAKEASKKINNSQTVVQKSQLPSNGASSSEDGGTHVLAPKQQQPAVELSTDNLNHSTQSSGSTGSKGAIDTSKDVSRVLSTSSYGFPEEAYKKRPCNCTKSQCLKLYCDCFANGEYCYNCNCKDCFNTFDHDHERQKAIRSTLERNPNAFKPKIGSIGSTDDGTRLHTKGCNCKRSGCLKNYCECYEGKIPCSSNCKCVGCRNTENFDMVYEYYSSNDASTKSVEEGSQSNILIIPDKIESVEGTTRRSSADMAGVKRSASFLETDLSQLPPTKQPHNFMTMDVIEATVQCMVAQADECMKRGCSMRTSELMILEEYGRCLLEIKEFAFNTEN
ncbi:protein lin-54 homolog [Anopheles funestus]|uniref:protein lin-54 homolog n=1 Tax=Anopheles funestus TaxID=62324 RepID=UPI0020C6F871|nr:protein lin-54 homolog [Anopheles funestus]XP_049291637.1 protein lin-54 homolog [Anopheles funestus]XP_049291639.1 protein lin-54 homolog [Anopheles funestus]